MTKAISPVSGMLVVWRAREEVPESLRGLFDMYIRLHGDHIFTVKSASQSDTGTLVSLERDGKVLCQSKGALATYFDWLLLKPILT